MLTDIQEEGTAQTEHKIQREQNEEIIAGEEDRETEEAVMMTMTWLDLPSVRPYP